MQRIIEFLIHENSQYLSPLQGCGSGTRQPLLGCTYLKTSASLSRYNTGSPGVFLSIKLIQKFMRIDNDYIFEDFYLISKIMLFTSPMTNIILI